MKLREDWSRNNYFGNAGYSAQKRLTEGFERWARKNFWLHEDIKKNTLRKLREGKSLDFNSLFCMIKFKLIVEGVIHLNHYCLSRPICIILYIVLSPNQ